MPDDAVLGIRDGARGSLLYGDDDSRVPAVELDAVADPTGAGNAFAGTLAAGLSSNARERSSARGRARRAAVATRSALPCGTAGWAPGDVAEARRWVERWRSIEIA